MGNVYTALAELQLLVNTNSCINCIHSITYNYRWAMILDCVLQHTFNKSLAQVQVYVIEIALLWLLFTTQD